MAGETTRDHLFFYLNGEPQRVAGDDAFLPLSQFLRERRHLVGTKVVCSEGDCGACTVLLGRPDGGHGLRWRAIDSCIAFVYQLDACHIVTVEALGEPDALSLVQQAMVDHYGSQCGFCTPGFVMALTGLAEESLEDSATRSSETVLGDAQLMRGLTGNLCRCTGYVQILDAARAVDLSTLEPLSARYPEAEIAVALRERLAESVDVAAGEQRVLIPTSFVEASRALASAPDTLVVAGATDLGVQHNKGQSAPGSRLALTPRIDGYGDVVLCEDELVIGAGATWRDVQDAIVASNRPSLRELWRLLELFGAPQIRHLATVGGNLVNASPIADSVPFFYAMDATLELVGPRGERSVSVEDFYRGYKDVDLVAGELVSRVRVPLFEDRAEASSSSGQTLRLYKVSRRRDLDISSFTAALRLHTRGDKIESARIAMGGVGPTVVRVVEAERVLEGQALTEDVFRRAGEAAGRQIEPISDVRGEAGYRRRLARNVFLRRYHELTSARAGTPLPSTAPAGLVEV